jgi:isocitrate lyase
MRTSPGRCTRTRASTPVEQRPRGRARINRAAARRSDRHAEGDDSTALLDGADRRRRRGRLRRPLNAFELMKSMIEAGAAGVHFEDQLASEKKCGHLGGKVLVPTSQFIRTLNAARLAADATGRADRARRAHRCRQREAHHQRRRRARPPFIDRRAHARGLLPHQRRPRSNTRSRAVSPMRPTPTSLVRDLDARPRRGEGFAEGSTASSPARCSPTTARRRSTGSATSTPRRSRSSSASSAPWATSSSSSRSPASTR